MTKRIGLYAWGGPGTVRLLQTKYHQPKINTASFLEMYDLPYLQRAKKLFDVTDVWVTYSWGFSSQTEKEDYQFILSRLKNFEQLHIKTHAYIQGLNVVTHEFLNQDIFCRDPKGHLLPYSKGRSFICPNNPQAAQLILGRVKAAAKESFAGIYIDNILFGLPPFYLSQEFTPFFGCACTFCREKFKKSFGYDLPIQGFKYLELADYLLFRTSSVQKFLEQAERICKDNKKEFGINLYDPFLHTPEIYFGYDLKKVSALLSYFLIENHQHPLGGKRSNQHLISFLKSVGDSKPTFVVSYKKGIGFEKAFNQKDVDAIFSESQSLRYSPCLKVTEFTTNGFWHGLDLQPLQPPSFSLSLDHKKNLSYRKIPQKNYFMTTTSKKFQNYYAPLLARIFESKRLSTFMSKSGLYQKQVRSNKKYVLEKDILIDGQN